MIKTPAVIVGLCAHGLAIARCLGRHGVPVTGIEARTGLPGTYTRWAKVTIVNDINGPELINTLLELGEKNNHPEKPVLFLTNDRMVRNAAENIQSLLPYYRLSWEASHSHILQFLNKELLEKRCKKVGLLYPRTEIIKDHTQIKRAVKNLGVPILVKPAQPLSSFKTRIINSLIAAEALFEKFSNDAPFLFQQYVPGGDEQLYFGALYMNNGIPKARFEGRKLRSYPPGRGGASAAESLPDNQVYQAALRFFKDINISGPVSLEVKKDQNGQFWVIEPTVGRTDYWVDCCIANGIAFPMIEYMDQIECETGNVTQLRSHLWFDSERDKLSPFSITKKHVKSGWAMRWSYLAADDIKPFCHGLKHFFHDTVSRIYHRIVRG